MLRIEGVRIVEHAKVAFDSSPLNERIFTAPVDGEAIYVFGSNPMPEVSGGAIRQERPEPVEIG